MVRRTCREYGSPIRPAVLVNRPIEILLSALNLHKQLVEMPGIAPAPSPSPQRARLRRTARPHPDNTVQPEISLREWSTILKRLTLFRTAALKRVDPHLCVASPSSS